MTYNDPRDPYRNQQPPQTRAYSKPDDYAQYQDPNTGGYDQGAYQQGGYTQGGYTQGAPQQQPRKTRDAAPTSTR